MKYPFLLFYRDDSNKAIDNFFYENNNKLQCTINFINKKEKISSKIIKKNLDFVKKQAEKEGITINELIKMLKSE